jgi:hypothetical protein
MKELDYLGGILVGKVLNKIDTNKVIDLKVGLYPNCLWNNLINLYCVIDFDGENNSIAVSVQQKKPVKYTREKVEKYCNKLCVKITEDLMNIDNFEPNQEPTLKYTGDTGKLVAMINAWKTGKPLKF